MTIGMPRGVLLLSVLEAIGLQDIPLPLARGVGFDNETFDHRRQPSLVLDKKDNRQQFYRQQENEPSSEVNVVDGCWGPHNLGDVDCAADTTNDSRD